MSNYTANYYSQGADQGRHSTQWQDASLSYIFLILFSILVLSDSIFGKYNSSGGTSIVSVASCLFFLFMAVRKQFTLDLAGFHVIAPLLVLALLYALFEDKTGLERGVRNSLFLIVVSTIFYLGSRIKDASFVPRYIDIIPIAVCLLFVWLSISSSSALHGFAETKNTVSGVLVHLTFMWLILRKESQSRQTGIGLELVTYSFLLAMCIIVSHRSFMAILGLCIVGTIALNLFRLKYYKIVFLLVFLTLIIYNYLLIYFMANIQTSTLFTYINNLSDEYFGRRFTSGREELWYLILYALRHDFWFGVGPGTLPSDFIDTTLSSHNSYLQVTLQMGVVGLMLVTLSMANIGFTIFNRAGVRIGNVSVVYFVAVTLHSSFEVILTQNNFPIASLIWLNFGLIYGIYVKDKFRYR